MEKIPFMLVVGDKEITTESVSIRLRTGEQATITVAEFKAFIKKMIDTKENKLTI